MKIVLLEPLGVDAARIEALAAPLRASGHSFISYDTKTTDPEELIRRVGDAECAIIANNPFPDAVVRACPNLKLLDVAFTGIDHVGLDACREKGVTVVNAAGYSNSAVAEMTLGMAIALLRRLPEGDRAVRSGGTSAGLRGREIAGRTVGVIGPGRIGARVARLFLAFGARVIATGRTKRPEVKALGVEYVPLETLLAQSDIVTLHVPSTPETRGMIDSKRIALMKPGAVFINCARGPIVDPAALADALNEGRIAGAAVDVFNVEPPIPDTEPLLHARNTILTPHVAFLTEESMLRRADIVFGNLRAWLGGDPVNVCAL